MGVPDVCLYMLRRRRARELCIRALREKETPLDDLKMEFKSFVYRWGKMFPEIADCMRSESALVIRYESLQTDFDNVCRALSLPQQVLSKLKSEQRSYHSCASLHYSFFYDQDLRNHVAASERDVIDYFGYTYEDHSKGREVGLI